jgi:hypothetical protein
MPGLPVTRVVLYKHGVGYFERQGQVENDAILSLTFKQAEVSDVLKSLTVLDLDGGRVASVSYDSTKPLEQLLEDVALSIPDEGSLVGLLPQLKGARVALQPTGGGSMAMRVVVQSAGEPVEGVLLGVDTIERQIGEGIARVVLVSLLTDDGQVRSFDLHSLAHLRLLDTALRRDLDYYLRTLLSAKKKDARTFTFFAQGQGRRTIRLSYTLGAPVWKATYRILLGEEGKPPMIQGWAVVDNTQDEDWEGVELALVAGLPVSFLHDLYTPRYIRRPVVEVKETTGVLPPEVEAGMALSFAEASDLDAAPLRDATSMEYAAATPAMDAERGGMSARSRTRVLRKEAVAQSAVSSTPAQVRARKIGDLFEYRIEHPVTIRRNQSALVPIVLRPFKGRPVLLYNKEARAENPMRCVEFENTTGLTLEGGPVTVLEGGTYVGEAMLDTAKPDERRLVPYAVELSVRVLDNVDTHDDRVHRVLFHRGHLFTDYTQVRQTTYHFDNLSETQQTVFLDHPRSHQEWTLFDTPAPVETTENFWRFSFPIAGKKATAFVVRQRRVVQNSTALGGIDDNVLGLWISQRYLDARTEQALREVIALQNERGNHGRQLTLLQQERARIHEEQNRIRQHLQSLGDRASEKDLRERFVRTLGAQEDRLEQIERLQREHTEESERCRRRVEELLDRLEYETRL